MPALHGNETYICYTSQTRKNVVSSSQGGNYSIATSPAEQEPLAWLFFAFSSSQTSPSNTSLKVTFAYVNCWVCGEEPEVTPRAPPAPRARSQRSARGRWLPRPPTTGAAGRPGRQRPRRHLQAKPRPRTGHPRPPSLRPSRILGRLPLGTQRSGAEGSERRENAERRGLTSARRSSARARPARPPSPTHACLRAISRCMGVAILTPGPEVRLLRGTAEVAAAAGHAGTCGLWAGCGRHRE